MSIYWLRRNRVTCNCYLEDLIIKLLRLANERTSKCMLNSEINSVTRAQNTPKRHKMVKIRVNPGCKSWFILSYLTATFSSWRMYNKIHNQFERERFYTTVVIKQNRMNIKTYRPTFLLMNTKKYEHVKIVWIKENKVMHFAFAL